ncbi:MAG: thioredoxin family protein [Alphaproteobacteria bacterium]
MALTYSTMLPLGSVAPEFELPDTAGQIVSLSDFRQSKGLVVAFICNHCPYVKHIKTGMAEFAREYQARGLAMVAISANDHRSYPQDAPARMAEDVESFGYVFPYLVDETQAVAHAYQAVCTPEFYLFDAERKLAYRGRFDASGPGKSEPVTGADLRAAADAVLNQQKVGTEQIPSVGCNIKWKPGNEPDYV